MSAARDDILRGIRAALGREALDSKTRAKLEERLENPPAYDRPPVDEDLVRSFETKLTAVQGGCTRTTEERLMQTIGECLDGHDLDRTFVASPALKHLSWPGDWTVTFGASEGGDKAAVTPCFLAVAETGGVVMLSGADTPTSLNFLPEFHIVLVRAGQLVCHVEDVWPRLRAAGAPPRATNFITGPSKTADVEQTIQYGAHGPRSLDVIFIEQDA